MDTISRVHQIQQTDVFAKWLSNLKDRKASARVPARIESIRQGNSGDSKSLGSGLHELRIHYGPGYRVYFTKKAGLVVLLLCGGNKSSQKKDIKLAHSYWNTFKLETVHADG